MEFFFSTSQLKKKKSDAWNTSKMELEQHSIHIQ